MKSQQKKQLIRLKNRYLVDIYAGLSKGESVKKIHKRLFDETINQKKLGFATSKTMLSVAFKATKTLKNQVGSPMAVGKSVKATYGSTVRESSPLELVSIFVFDLIKKKDVEKSLSKEITSQLDRDEGKRKKDGLKASVDENRKEENPKIFYLASKHNDCALDHKDYQGKMYIDEKWESVIQDERLKKKVSKYVKRNNVRTMQWVMGRPVWFITRPNCRHYFKAIDTKEALKRSVKSLLKKHKMKTAIGNREYLQTLKHPTDRKWYQDIRNAELLLEKYKERLKLHQDMYRESKNEILAMAIQKDKMLIAKWEEYIRSRKK